MGLWNRLSSAVSTGWNKGRNAISGAINAAKSGIGNAYNATKRGLGKAYNAAKEFASNNAETIGKIASAGLNAAAPALDAFGVSTLGVPIGTTLNAGTKMISRHLAKDDTGWGRLAKGLSSKSSGGGLSSQLESQSKAIDTSNGHVATGYSISTTGNFSKPSKTYSGRNHKQSRVL